ncbi:MAG: HAD-IB family phosphatase [Chitinophagaceae bacterium]
MINHTRKQTVHVFDVDGTITGSDSFIILLRYFMPSLFTRLGAWLRVTPVLIKCIFIGDLSQTKLALLSQIWKGQAKEDIYQRCQLFFNQQMKADLRLSAFKYIMELKDKQPDQKIILLSASCREWLAPLADFFAAGLICTELQYDHQQRFTGEFATPNCKGKEKLRRLLNQYPASEYEFVCYGNSPGDKKLRSISKEFYYRYF